MIWTRFHFEMKLCAKCGNEKPITDFYVKDKATNRLSSKCKTCCMKDVKAYRASHIEDFRAIDRRRGMLPHRVSARDKWKAKYPERAMARYIVDRAIKKGYIVRLPCIVCGKKAQGHHPDYSEPLNVVWLCPEHHQQEHAIIRGNTLGI